MFGTTFDASFDVNGGIDNAGGFVSDKFMSSSSSLGLFDVSDDTDSILSCCCSISATTTLFRRGGGMLDASGSESSSSSFWYMSNSTRSWI